MRVSQRAGTRASPKAQPTSAPRRGRALCTRGAVAPLLCESGHRSSSASYGAQAPRLGARGRREAFPSNGGAATSRHGHSELLPTVGRPGVPSSYLRAGRSAVRSSLSARLCPSFPTLSHPRSPRATSRRDPACEARPEARGGSPGSSLALAPGARGAHRPRPQRDDAGVYSSDR